MKRHSIDAYWLALLAALCIIRFWVAPLGSSFWVDEMATSFVVNHGASDPTLRVAPQVPIGLVGIIDRALTFRFVSNVDGTDFAEAVQGVDPAERPQ